MTHVHKQTLIAANKEKYSLLFNCLLLGDLAHHSRQTHQLKDFVKRNGANAKHRDTIHYSIGCYYWSEQMDLCIWGTLESKGMVTALGNVCD